MKLWKSLLIAGAVLLPLQGGLRAADAYRLNNANNLNTTGAWSTGAIPGTGDTAVWDSRITTAGNCTNNPGNNLSWLGIRIANPVQPVTITNGGTLRTITLLGGGIDLNSPTSTVDFVVNCQLVVGAPQTWNIKAGRTLAFGPNSGAPASVVMNADLTPLGYVKMGRTLDVNSNSTLTIADGTTLEFTLNSEAALRIGNNAYGGTVNQTGGTVRLARSGATRNVLNIGQVALNAGAVATYNLSGGLLDADDSLDYLISIANSPTSPGVLNVAGSGELYAGQMNIGFRTNGSLNISGNGFVQALTKFQLGGVSGGQIGSGTVNLDGGTLIITNIIRGGGTGAAIVNFNGGLLKPAVNQPLLVDSSGGAATPIQLRVKAGGARIDTAGLNAGISHPFEHDSGTPDGGLVKLGLGALTLTGTNTYDGETLVSSGTLAILTAHGAGGITVSNAATIGVTVAAPGDTLETAFLALGEGTEGVTTNEINLAAFGSPLNPVVYATNLAVNGTNFVNISGVGLAVGQFPLIKYETAPGLTDTSFAAGSMPQGVSGYVTNNAASHSIDLVITAVPNLVWRAQTDTNWDASTLNWVDAGTGGDVMFFPGAVAIFDDTASNTLVYAATALAPGKILVQNIASNYQFVGEGSIAGGGTLTKLGAGTLTIALTNNTYAGDTLISNGMVVVAAPNAIPDGAGMGNVLVDGTLNLGGFNEAINGLTGGGTLDSTGIPGATNFLSLGNNNAAGTFSGTIRETAGTLALSKAGSGTLTLAGNNSYSGGTTNLAGTLLVGHDSALGSGLVELRGGTLATAGDARTLANPLSITAGTPAFDTTDGDLILLGPLSDLVNADPSKTGDNSLIVRGGMLLAGPAGSASGWNIARGFVVVDACVATNTDDGIRVSAVNGTAAGLVLTNSATYVLGTSSGSPNLRLGNTANLTGTNYLLIQTGDFVMELTAREIIAGDTASTTGLVTQTGGTVRWTNNNSTGIGVLLGNSAGSHGVYNLDGGTLITPRVRRAAGAGYFNFNGGTLSPSTNLYAATFMQGLTEVGIQDGGAIIDSAGIDLTVAQPLLAAGSGGLTKRGAGTLTLAGVNTYAGATVVAEGRLDLAPEVFVAGGAIAVSNNAALGVALATPGTSLNTAELMLGAGGAATLSLDLGTAGNPAAPVINATSLVVNGACIISLAGGNLTAGQFPLIDYSGGIGGNGFAGISLGSLPPGLNATLVDNVANASVDLRIASSTPYIWKGTTDANWDTNGTVNWTLSGADAAYADGSMVRFDDDALQNLNVSLAGPLFPSAVTVSNEVYPSYSFGGPGWISGAASLAKQGAGTLTISNNNDFSGIVTISGGTLVAAHSNALGSVAGGTVITSGGTLDVSGNLLNRELITVSGGGAGGDGAIVNSGSAQQNATRFLTLAGDATFGGSQRWDVRGASGQTNAVLGTDGQPYRLTKVGSNFFAIVNAQVDPALDDIEVREGGLGYEANSTSLGNPARTLTIHSNAYVQMYQNVHPLNKNLLIKEGGVLRGNSGTSNVITGPVTLEAGMGLLYANSGATLTLSNTVSGAGGVRKVQGGTVTLAANNAYAGPTRVEAGVLAVNADAGLGAAPASPATAHLVLNGGTLRANNGFTLDPNRGLALGPDTGSGSGTIEVGSGLLDYPGTAADNPGGTGALIKSGGGALRLGADNAYTGGSTLLAGFVQAGGDMSLGSGPVTFGGGGLASDGTAPRTFTNALIFTSAATLGDTANSGRLTFTGSIDFGGAARLLTCNSEVIIAGSSTNGRPHKQGPGTLTVQGVHTWTGDVDVFNHTFVLDGGTVTNPGAFRPNCNVPGGTARLVFTNGALVVLNNANPNFRAGFSGGDGTQTNILDLAGTCRTPNADASNGRLIIGRGSAKGIVNLLPGGDLEVRYIQSGDGTPRGESEFNFMGGVLRPKASHGDFIQGLTNAFVRDGGAIIDSQGFVITVGQRLLNGGAGGLEKRGLGTLTLTNANSYIGDTLVSGGTLALSGAGLIAASPNITLASGTVLDVSGVAGGFLLADGQTLRGDGVVNGPVTVAAAAAIAPGASIGTLTLDASPVLGGSIAMQINKTGPALTADKLAVNAPLAYGGALSVTLLGGSDQLSGGEAFDLFDATTLSGAFAATNLPPLAAGLNWWLGNLSVDGTILVNRAPSAGDSSISITANQAATLEGGKLLARSSDPDGNTLVIASVGASTNGANVALAAGRITYTPVANFVGEDRFTVTVSDGQGGSATATIVVTVAAAGEGYNRVGLLDLGGGTVRLSYQGIPGYNYALDWTTNLVAPAVWVPVITNTAAENGALTFTNTSFAPANFYRVRHAP